MSAEPRQLERHRAGVRGGESGLKRDEPLQASQLPTPQPPPTALAQVTPLAPQSIAQWASALQGGLQVEFAPLEIRESRMNLLSEPERSQGRHQPMLLFERTVAFGYWTGRVTKPIQLRIDPLEQRWPLKRR